MVGFADYDPSYAQTWIALRARMGKAGYTETKYVEPVHSKEVFLNNIGAYAIFEKVLGPNQKIVYRIAGRPVSSSVLDQVHALGDPRGENETQVREWSNEADLVRFDGMVSDGHSDSVGKSYPILSGTPSRYRIELNTQMDDKDGMWPRRPDEFLRPTDLDGSPCPGGLCLPGPIDSANGKPPLESYSDGKRDWLRYGGTEAITLIELVAKGALGGPPMSYNEMLPKVFTLEVTQDTLRR